MTILKLAAILALFTMTITTALIAPKVSATLDSAKDATETIEKAAKATEQAATDASTAADQHGDAVTAQVAKDNEAKEAQWAPASQPPAPKPDYTKKQPISETSPTATPGPKDEPKSYGSKKPKQSKDSKAKSSGSKKPKQSKDKAKGSKITAEDGSKVNPNFYDKTDYNPVPNAKSSGSKPKGDSSSSKTFAPKNKDDLQTYANAPGFNDHTCWNDDTGRFNATDGCVGY